MRHFIPRTACCTHLARSSWDKGVLTDLCLKGVLTDLCLTLYIKIQQTKYYEILFHGGFTALCQNILILVNTGQQEQTLFYLLISTNLMH